MVRSEILDNCFPEIYYRFHWLAVMGKKSTKKTQLPNHQVMKELTNKLIKDLKILDSTLYSCRITIRMGGSSDVTIKLEDILDKKSIK
ncbi:MAG: hypothetical protein RL037_2290, partial [Bacteroidota bacterium]